MLSSEPETIYLSSLVTATLFTQFVCPFNTVSCRLSTRFQKIHFSNRSHILIVLSVEPEIMYLLSLVTARVNTEEVCPLNTFFCFLSNTLQILIELSFPYGSPEQEMTYLLSLVSARFSTAEVCPFITVSC